MPLSYGSVPFSEMKPGMQHQGPRTAGNKSLLTFRSDVGIPGCTTYTPGWCSVPIPIKGSTQHTGRMPDEHILQDAAAKETGQHQAASEYCSTYQDHSACGHAATKTGGGFWFEERQHKAAGNSPPFLGSSTYSKELLQGGATAAQQLEQSIGVGSTLVAYEVARAHRPMSHTLSKTTASISTGALLGYQTTYKSSTAQTELAANKGSAMARRPVSCSGAERLRMAVMPSAGKPSFDGFTTYARDFGTAGSDPMLRATSSNGMGATTDALDQGTTRASRLHPPGYTGFIPAASTNELAVQQGCGTTVKQDIKANMLPVTLDQYSRGRLVHYTGYKPHAGPGATTVQPAHGPTAETTQGFVNMQVSRHGPQPHDPSHCINSRKGIMNFFTGGGASISDNGEADAQRFFVRLRPLEGRLKTYTASATNHSGAKFTS